MPIAEPEGPREPLPKVLMGVKEHIEAVGERRVVNVGRGMGQSLGEMDRPLCEFPHCNALNEANRHQLITSGIVGVACVEFVIVARCC